MKVTRGKKKTKKKGRLYIGILLLFLIAVMSVQLMHLYQKKQKYIRQENACESQLKEQNSQKKKLQTYEAYTKTDKYIEDTAQSKLGLVHNNEIIFKEK